MCYTTGNNEQEWYTPDNAKVTKGRLILEARKLVTEDGVASYTSAKIVSRGKADFGVIADKNNRTTLLESSRLFEARIKLPWGQGIWPAFWMLPTHNSNWPKTGEIDIMVSAHCILLQIGT